MLLYTERLVLRVTDRRLLEACLVGCEALVDALGAEAPASWPPPLLDENALDYLLENLDDEATSRGWGLWYVTLRRTDGEGLGELLGVCGIKGTPDEDGVVEIGYGIVPEQQRRGFATEASRAVIEFIFSHPEVTRIQAHTLEQLAPSRRVLEKLGFREVPADDLNDDTDLDELRELEDIDEDEVIVRYVLERPS